LCFNPLIIQVDFEVPEGNYSDPTIEEEEEELDPMDWESTTQSVFAFGDVEPAAAKNSRRNNNNKNQKGQSTSMNKLGYEKLKLWINHTMVGSVSVTMKKRNGWKIYLALDFPTTTEIQWIIWIRFFKSTEDISAGEITSQKALTTTSLFLSHGLNVRHL
jgi:hypothetical protein